jgi:hypothetical protein
MEVAKNANFYSLFRYVTDLVMGRRIQAIKAGMKVHDEAGISGGWLAAL